MDKRVVSAEECTHVFSAVLMWFNRKICSGYELCVSLECEKQLCLFFSEELKGFGD